MPKIDPEFFPGLIARHAQFGLQPPSAVGLTPLQAKNQETAFALLGTLHAGFESFRSDMFEKSTPEHYDSGNTLRLLESLSGLGNLLIKYSNLAALHVIENDPDLSGLSSLAHSILGEKH